MPKYRMKLNNLSRDLIQKNSGIIQAPNLNKALIDEVIKEILKYVEPVVSWELFPYDANQAKILKGEGMVLNGKKLPHRLCQCHHIIVFAICLGDLQAKIAKHMEQGELLKAILMEDTSNAAINQILITLEKNISASINKASWQFTERYLVGYGDGEINDGRGLLALIQGEQIGITFDDEGLIYPRQTMLAVMGVYEGLKVSGEPGAPTMPCQKCQYDSCDFREQEYRQPKEEDWEAYMKKDEKFTVADLMNEKEK